MKIVVGSVSFILLGILIPFTLNAQDPTEGYYKYLYDDGGDYPPLSNPGWHEEVQGITHDDNYWYITNNEASPRDPRIWKIPVSHDLATTTASGVDGVERVRLWSFPAFSDEYYDHVGDVSYYNHRDVGYLVIAIENYPCCEGLCCLTDECPPCQDPAIAVFNADTLEFIDYAKLEHQLNGPWVAVDSQGILYCSNGGGVTAIERLYTDWDKIQSEGVLEFYRAAPLILYDENGDILTLDSMQGGVISPSDELLYLVGNDRNNTYAHGVQVIDLSSGKRVEHSTNGSSHFNFHFDPDGYPDDMEEPEGITIWDLNDGRAPGISGSLHAIVLDNDWPSSDEVMIEHFTNRLIINGSYQGIEDLDKIGTPTYPFKTVRNANIESWNGALLLIHGGSYPESVTFRNRLEIRNYDGNAVIGQ